MKFSEKQRKIIETTANKVIVLASAAAGKTTVLTERIKFLLSQGVVPENIVAITFTNLAAEEIHERVGKSGENCFIGTIHSYCNRLLVSQGIDTSKFIEREEFDELFEEIERHPECVKNVEYLLLDEAQDSNEKQFTFLLDLIRPDNFMLVGDHRQSIYRFSGAKPDILVNMLRDESITVYDLNENYRNGKEILKYAKTIIEQNGYDYMDTSECLSNRKGKVTVVEYSPDGIARTIKRRGNYKDWFILGRKNSDLETMKLYLQRNGVPFCIIRKKDFNSNNELRKKMSEDCVKLMTIHASKGLEANNVVVIGAKIAQKMPQEETCISYVAATRAKEELVWTTKARKRKSINISWE